MLRLDARAGEERATFSDDVRPGNGAQRLGDALTQTAQGLTGALVRHNNKLDAERAQIEAESDAVYLAHTGAGWRSTWSQKLQGDLDNYSGEDAGFALDFTQRYHREAEALVAKTPERLRARVELELIRQGEILVAAADEGERGRRQAFAMNRLSETVDTQAESVRVMPDLFWDAVDDDAMAQLQAAAPQGRAANGSTIGEALVKETTFKLASAYADALLDKDPGRLMDELEAGRLDPYISAGQKSNWMATAKGAFEAEETRVQQAADRALSEIKAEANDLTSRVKAYYAAGLPPPRDLVNAAHQANARVPDAGNDEAIELARYAANRGTKEDRKSAAKAALGDLGDAFKLGLQPSQEMIAAARAEVAASGSRDLIRDLQDLEKLAGKRQEFAFMTPAQADARIRELRGGADGASRDDVKELELLQTVSAAREKAIGDGDLVGWLASNGVPLQELAPGMENFGEAAVQRMRLMAAASADMGAPLQFFGKAEGERFARGLETLPPEKWMETMGALGAIAGGDIGAVIEGISETAPMDAQAAMLTAQGRGATTRAILAGREALKSNPKLAPKRSDADVIAAEADVIGGAIPPELAAHRNEIGEAARAWYAGEQQRRGGDGEFDESVYETALQQAAGRNDDKGGFGKVNGARTLLPPHLSEDDVSELIKSGELFGRNFYRYSYGNPRVSDVAGPPAWKDPVTGKLEVFDAKELKNAKLVALGSGHYWVKNGDGYVLDLITEQPFVLDLGPAEAPARSKSNAYLDDPLTAARSR